MGMKYRIPKCRWCHGLMEDWEPYWLDGPRDNGERVHVYCQQWNEQMDNKQTRMVEIQNLGSSMIRHVRV